MRIKTFGTKIINPIIAEKIAHTNTAPAAISLAFLANSCFSGETKSTRFSIAEFINSAPKTKPKQSKQTSHSVLFMSKIKPQITTKIAITK